MRLVTSCVRLACDVELLSNNRQYRNNPNLVHFRVREGWATFLPERGLSILLPQQNAGIAQCLICGLIGLIGTDGELSFEFYCPNSSALWCAPLRPIGKALNFLKCRFNLCSGFGSHFFSCMGNPCMPEVALQNLADCFACCLESAIDI